MCLKKCSKCKEPKSKSAFNKRSHSKDGLNHQCKECISKRRKELRVEQNLRLKTEINKINMIENRFEKLDDKEAYAKKLQKNENKSKRNYVLNNTEKKKKSQKLWRDKNKDKIKLYNDERKEKRKEYDKQRYLKSKKECQCIQKSSN